MDVYGTWELYDPRTPDVVFASLSVYATAKSGALHYLGRDFPLISVTEMTAQRLRAGYSADRFHGTLDAQIVGDDHLEIKFTGNVNVQLRGRRPLTHATPPPPPTVVKPALDLKIGFLPAVLRSAEFQKDGILFGEESEPRDCRWVVIDPNRHDLQVWRKSSPTQDIVTAGQALGASVFSNGPMFQYKTPGASAYIGYYVQGAVTSWGLSYTSWADSGAKPFQAWDEAAVDWFGAGPVGCVIGRSRGINLQLKAPHLGYFGRGTTTDFVSYEIGSGKDPTHLVEAIGGLYAPAVKDYAIAEYEAACHSSMWFFWGLAPLSPQDARFKDAGLAEALAAYAAAGSQKPVTGLIVGLYYHSNSHAQLLVDIGVKDAAKLDGSDSVLFGRGSEVFVGQSMFQGKRVGQGWGFAFFPSQR